MKAIAIAVLLGWLIAMFFAAAVAAQSCTEAPAGSSDTMTLCIDANGSATLEYFNNDQPRGSYQGWHNVSLGDLSVMVWVQVPRQRIEDHREHVTVYAPPHLLVEPPSALIRDGDRYVFVILQAAM